MAKITAVIDIGSNSARMAVYERTSQFGFHLIKEIKSRVRISEDTYENEGYLQPAPMERAFHALKEFKSIAEHLKVRKILCVATSAVRDAPNRREFINKVKQATGINIKVIEGQKEAFYGAVAAMNLLHVDEGITIDIGGGSTECAYIRDGKIEDLYSLNIGTIRLKELFFDQKRSTSDAMAFVRSEIEKLPASFRNRTVIGIGGTIRALSKAIMSNENYPLKILHGYEVDLEKHGKFYENVYKSAVLNLRKLGVKEDRLDTIREGSLILSMLIEQFDAQKLVTSGVGIREGVFLSDMLRNNNNVFPKEFNPSARSLTDRFCNHEMLAKYQQKAVLEIFDALVPLHNVDGKYKYHLKMAARLVHIGIALDYYAHRHHGRYMLSNSLTYGFTHEDRVLIALLVQYHEKKLPDESTIAGMEMLYPELEDIQWLSFFLSLAECINADYSCPDVTMRFVNQILYIDGKQEMHLAKEAIKKLVKPAPIAIIVQQAG